MENYLPRLGYRGRYTAKMKSALLFIATVLCQFSTSVAQDTRCFVVPIGLNPEATTHSIHAAIASGKYGEIQFAAGHQYLIDPIEINRSVRVCGHSQIVPNDITKPILNVNSTDVVIDGLTFFGLNKSGQKSSYRRFIKVHHGADRFRLRNCEFRNFVCRARTTQMYCVEIELNGVEDWLIENCHFRDIQNEVNGKQYKAELERYAQELEQWKRNGEQGNKPRHPRKPGFVGAIRIAHSNNWFGTYPSTGVIRDCTFRNIWSSPVGDLADFPGDWYDGDAIRIYVDREAPAGHANPNVDDDVSVKVVDCEFFDIQKSAVKAGEISRASISNCRVFNNRTDFPMMAAFRSNRTKGIRVMNCEVFGHAERGIYIGNGGSVYVADLTFIPYTTDPNGKREKGCGIAAIELGRGDYQAGRVMIRGVYASNSKWAINCVNCKNVSLHDVSIMEAISTVNYGPLINKNRSTIHENNVIDPFGPR